MSSMEMFILFAAAGASIGGTLILLSCLSSRRAQLVRYFNQLQQMADRERALQEHAVANPPDTTPVP